MRYLPNEARREAESAIAAAQEEASRQRAAAEEFSKRCDVAERRVREAEAEAARKVREAEWTFMQESTACKERIEALERLLEEERAAHTAELQHVEEVSQKAQEDAENRAQQAEDRCAAATASAEARVAEAEQAADEARRSAAAEVATVRTHEEARVQKVRQQASEHVQEVERQRRLEADQLRSEVAAERRAMEEMLRLHVSQKEDALQEAERRVALRDQNLEDWKSQKELALARREASLDEWVDAHHKQSVAAEAHNKELLELERDMHKRTVERTMDRVARHLTCGREPGNDTPTGEVLNATLLPGPAAELPAEEPAPAAAARELRGFDVLIEAVLSERADLILAYPGDLNERGQYSRDQDWWPPLPPGYTALIVAVVQGKHRSAKALLQAGADARQRDASGAFPLAIAHAAGQPELAELISTWRPGAHASAALGA